MKKFMGYVVVNKKLGLCYDGNGNNITEYDIEYAGIYEDKSGAKELLDEIDWFITNHDNKDSRKIAKQRKNIKITKLYMQYV